MNAERRKILADIIASFDSHRDRLEEVRDIEQEAFDNLPENLQQAEKGETMENAVQILDEQVQMIDDIIANLQELIDV